MIRPRRPPSRLEFELVFWGNIVIAVVFIACLCALGYMMAKP